MNTPKVIKVEKRMSGGKLYAVAVTGQHRVTPYEALKWNVPATVTQWKEYLTSTLTEITNQTNQ